VSGTAVITVAHGRHDHWQRQQAALRASACPPDIRVLVAIDDIALADIAERADPTTVVIPVRSTTDGLPLSSARNAGARAALERGAGVLIFLDVDCLPAPGLVEAYASAAEDPVTCRSILCGPVTYLPPPPAGGYDLARLADRDDPHPARPAPDPGEVLIGGSHDLFWSLSFAVTGDIWRLLGGFHEGYAGYGGEDTDFGRLARARGVGLAWIGDARAYHQWHPSGDPPVQHLASILRNSRLFRRRWGEWPMRGWLDGFVERGLIVASPDGDYTLPAAGEGQTMPHEGRGIKRSGHDTVGDETGSPHGGDGTAESARRAGTT
jgi:hypothetical protein